MSFRLLTRVSGSQIASLKQQSASIQYAALFADDAAQRFPLRAYTLSPRTSLMTRETNKSNDPYVCNVIALQNKLKTMRDKGKLLRLQV